MSRSKPAVFFDPRIHPASLSEQDFETLQIFGVTTVIAVSDATAHPATPAGLFAHFEHLLTKQLPRIERSGLRGYVALGVPPAALPRRGLEEILEALPSYFRAGKVVALGQLGLWKGTEFEEEALLAQLAVAYRFRKPAIVSAPTEDKERVTRRLLATLQRSELPPSRILVDGAVGKTVRAIRALGFYAGLTIHPEHLTVEKAVALVKALGSERLILDTAAGDGASDIVSMGRAAHRLGKALLSPRIIARVTQENAAALFGL